MHECQMVLLLTDQDVWKIFPMNDAMAVIEDVFCEYKVRLQILSRQVSLTRYHHHRFSKPTLLPA